LHYGTHWSFYNDRARIHRGADHFEEALQDSDAALAIAPDSPDVLIGRLYSLLRLGRNDEIPPIVELIEAIDPMNADLPAFKKEALRTAAGEGYNLQQDSKSGESIERLTAGIALNGSDAEAYYWRGRAYLRDNQDDKALADFETVVRLDPTHFESCRNIDYIHAKRGEWTEVISMWNTYLERKPDDGKAIFERAGAYHHSGNMTLAMQDAKAACGLGVQEACAVASR
jgi:tetratricopeptide (TPR) repeat protein